MSQTKAILEESNLSTTSAHFGLAMIENEPQVALNFAQVLGMRKVIIHSPDGNKRPSDEKGWNDFSQHLEKLGKPFLDAGIKLGWHNHAFEFYKPRFGNSALEFILTGSPSLSLELDIAWISIT